MPDFTMIQDGMKSRGNGLLVGDQGEILTRGAPAVPATTYALVGASAMLVAAMEGRTQVIIQNLDPANPLNIKLGPGPVTALDILVAAGESFSFPQGVTYKGQIDGVGPVAAVQVVITEFA